MQNFDYRQLAFSTMKRLFFLLAGLVLFACESEPTPPAEVVKQFQGHIDKNEFAEAKALSTPRGQQRLDDLEAIIAGELADSSIFNTTFLEIDCRINGDTARCLCLVEDSYERYETDYKLVKMDGKWRVDVPEEESVDEEEFIEMLDSLNYDSLFQEEER